MQTDVIIIGAGAAGLSASKDLTKQGISFILLSVVIYLVVPVKHIIYSKQYHADEETTPMTKH